MGTHFKGILKKDIVLLPKPEILIILFNSCQVLRVNIKMEEVFWTFGTGRAVQSSIRSNITPNLCKNGIKIGKL